MSRSNARAIKEQAHAKQAVCTHTYPSTAKPTGSFVLVLLLLMSIMVIGNSTTTKPTGVGYTSTKRRLLVLSYG